MDEPVLNFDDVVAAYQYVVSRRAEAEDEPRARLAQTYLDTLKAGKTNGYKKQVARHFEDIVGAIFKTVTHLELCRRLKEIEQEGGDLAPIVSGDTPIVLDGDRIKNAWAVTMEALLELSARAIGEVTEDK